MKRKERLVRAGAFTVFAIEEVLALLRLLLAGIDVDGCTFQTQALYLGSVVHVHYRILEVVNYSRKVKLGSLIDVLDQFLCLLLFQISFVVLMDHCDFGHVNIFLWYLCHLFLFEELFVNLLEGLWFINLLEDLVVTKVHGRETHFPLAHQFLLCVDDILNLDISFLKTFVLSDVIYDLVDLGIHSNALLGPPEGREFKLNVSFLLANALSRNLHIFYIFNFYKII